MFTSRGTQGSIFGNPGDVGSKVAGDVFMKVTIEKLEFFRVCVMKAMGIENLLA